MTDKNEIALAEALDAFDRVFPSDPESVAGLHAYNRRSRLPARDCAGQIEEVRVALAAVLGSDESDEARWRTLSYESLRLALALGFFLPAGHTSEAFEPGHAFASLTEEELVALSALRANPWVYRAWQAQHEKDGVPVPDWYARRAREFAAELGEQP